MENQFLKSVIVAQNSFSAYYHPSGVIQNHLRQYLEQKCWPQQSYIAKRESKHHLNKENKHTTSKQSKTDKMDEHKRLTKDVRAKEDNRFTNI